MALRSALGALVLAGALASCGSDGGGSSDAETGPTTARADETTTTTEADAVAELTGEATVFQLVEDYSIAVSWDIDLVDVVVNVADAAPGKAFVEPVYEGTITLTNTTEERRNRLFIAEQIGLALAWPTDDFTGATGLDCTAGSDDIEVTVGSTSFCPALRLWSEPLPDLGGLSLEPDETITVGLGTRGSGPPRLSVSENSTTGATTLLSAAPELVLVGDADSFASLSTGSELAPQCYVGTPPDRFGERLHAFAVVTGDGRQLGTVERPPGLGGGRGRPCDEYLATPAPGGGTTGDGAADTSALDAPCGVLSPDQVAELAGIPVDPCREVHLEPDETTTATSATANWDAEGSGTVLTVTVYRYPPGGAAAEWDPSVVPSTPVDGVGKDAYFLADFGEKWLLVLVSDEIMLSVRSLGDADPIDVTRRYLGAS